MEAELQKFLNRNKLPPAHERVRLAHMFLRERGEPTDIPHVLVALKALSDLYHEGKELDR